MRTDQEDNDSIVISWEPPYSLDGVPIIGYWIYYTKNNGTPNTPIELLGNSTAYRFSMVNSSVCDTYLFQVRAINAGGEGNLSKPIETHTSDSK